MMRPALISDRFHIGIAFTESMESPVGAAQKETDGAGLAAK